jgi:hypothetical protein
MALHGKGFFIWKIANCEGGNANLIASEAQEAGLSHVLIKVANGIYSYNYNWDLMLDLVPPVAQALRSKGIEVWGWHYVYGDQAISEAQIAIRRVQELNLDGYVIDAEAEYKQSGKETAAKQFMTEIRGGLGNSVPIALSSYRYPSLHPIPWNAFLEKCDYVMPQVYWMEAHNPGAQLEQCLREYESPNIKYHPPMVPVGAAFTEHGWTPTTSEILEFLDTARALNLTAANFWEWSNCRDVLTPQHEVWDLITNYNWETGTPLPKDITELYIEALNNRDIETIMRLYDDRAVHITAARTVFGKPAIQAWFNSFLNQLLPDAQFSRTGFSGSGNSRHFTWVAHAEVPKVLNGNDILGLADGKISYHYTYFTVTG